MEPIRVPRPPAEAFNKNRRISDLIRAQVNQFKHLEEKLSAEQRRGIPQHGITSEAEAAHYIAAMTAFLRGQPAAAAAPGPEAVPNIKLAVPQRAPAIRRATGIAIAASGDMDVASKAQRKATAKPASKRKNPAPKKSSNSKGKGNRSGPKEGK